MKFYLKNYRGSFDAVAEYSEDTKTFTVLKGSRVSNDISNAPTFRGAKAIAKRREESAVKHIVINDVVFTSPSTAANFVTGRSSDGCALWKDDKGRSFKEITRGE